MVIITNNYTGDIHSFDGPPHEIMLNLRASFPHLCEGSNLKSNLDNIARTQAYSVWSDEHGSNESLGKNEYAMPQMPSDHAELLSTSIPFQQQHAKHIFEHLSQSKRNALRSLLVGCGLDHEHPHFYGLIVNKPFDYLRSEPFQKMVHRNLNLNPQDAQRMKDVVHQIASEIRNIADSTLYDPVHGTFVQHSKLDMKKGELGNTLYEKPKETAIQFGHKLSVKDKNPESDVVSDMIGASNPFHRLIEAAKLVANRDSIPLERARYAFVRFEDDPEAAALYAVGLQDNQANRSALHAAAESSPMHKAESVEDDGAVKPPHTILPTDEDSKKMVDEIINAYREHGVHKIELGGKHSKGTLIARDPRTMHVWLLKPGSGSVSPAAGVADETASQSSREAAFSHVARAWGLGEYVIRAEMLNVDNSQWAALYMLPFDYQNADKWKKADPSFLFRAMEHYRLMGVLHKLAVLDFVLGNPDRHAQNVMISRRGEMSLIDHGSAFAGSNFAPGTDKKSFVPFYLRYNAKNFSTLPDNKERLRMMPRVPKMVQSQIANWIADIDQEQMVEILTRFGIKPTPEILRLGQIKKLLDSDTDLDFAINMLWVTT